MIETDTILTGMIAGAWAFLWCRVLTMPDMAGNIVPVLYWRAMGSQKNWKLQLAKPLFECPLCHSFWIAVSMVVLEAATVSISEGFGVVVAAIFTAFILDRKYGE